MALRSDYSLLFETRVQLVVSCITIKTYVVFETLLVLITGQFAVAGQLEREIYLQKIGLFLKSREWR